MIAVLHRNLRYLALDKPPGVTVIPARDEDPALALRHRAERELGCPLWVVHRIDRDTSGVVLFALDADAHRALSMAFERGDILKTYQAWVAGMPDPAEGRIDVPLHSARKGKMRPALRGEAGAKPAVTRYQLLAAARHDAAPIARLRCEPETGRQHQIRVHLRSIGHPILGDPLYGAQARDWAKRTLLHAHRLTVPALDGIAAQVIEAPLPSDFRI